MATRPPRHPETKPAAQADARPVSFDINHPLIQQAIQQAVATAMAAKAAEIPATRSEKSQQLEFLTLKNFKKAGYKDVKPRENVKTYNLWIAAGRKVKPGEHAVAVRNLRLFFISQTEPISAEEQAAILAKAKAKADRPKATVTPLHQPSA
jgi:hypothetical protein